MPIGPEIGPNEPPIPTRDELERAGIHIAVAVPLERNVPDLAFLCFWQIARRGWPLIDPDRLYGRTDINRNSAGVAMLKQSHYTHVMMFDSDHSHAADTVERHARWVLDDPRRLVVGGLHFKRGEPYEPCIFNFGPDGRLHAPINWEKGLAKVDVIGHGTLLVAREVFEKLPKPWWAYTYSEVDKDLYPSDDMYFSWLCREHGIAMWCDTTATSPHIITGLIDESAFRKYIEANPNKVILSEELPAAAAKKQAAEKKGKRRLVVDGVIFQLQAERPAGISRIWRELIPELQRAMPKWEVIVLRRGGYPTRIQGVKESGLPPYDLNDQAGDARRVAQKCRDLGADVFMSTYYSRPDESLVGVPNLQMVYDMIPEFMGFFDPSNPEWGSKQTAFSDADAFVAISQTTADDLHALGIGAERIAVTLCGVSNDFSPRQPVEAEAFMASKGVKGAYFLMIGNRAGYKNGAVVLEAHKDFAGELVCIGGESEDTETPGVHYLPSMNSSELALAYSAARGLIYPSLYEGFGLPILEAMACGCPVIIGRHGSIPEVAGGAAIYCDMTDPKAIAQACLWLTDPVQGDHFAQLGRERAAQFSWSRMAAEVARQVERLAEPVQSAEVLVDKPAPQAKKKRALLSYLTAPLQLPKDYRGAFSNAGIVRSWVQVLEEMGYLVDVVDWDTTEFEPAQPYDLFVGHGGRNWSHITAQLPPDCIKVYFSTGSPWERHNWAEASRFDDLQLRRLVRLPGDRQITAEETTAYHEADGIIVLGNRAAATEFTDYPFVKAAHAVDCGVYPDDHFDPAKKDYGAGRNRFLFFSGIGNMHKGLDLLLEAFAGMLEAELFIATNVEPEFAKVYARELALPNVHVEGWVELKGRRFYELVDTCDWVVLPSCSEGQPGSVLECMNQGLVPIVTKACHLDIGEDGRLIEFPTPLSIRADIRTVMEWPEDAIARAASRVWEMARVRHSPEAFRKGLLSAVEEIRASRPIVSAIVSTYNSEKFLPGCLDDLEAQTLADRLEIIVVNSGSQQGERAIVEAYQARFQNIRYIETAERETVYAAWNRGAKEARGRYLTNANTDDRSHPERMERLARELDAHAELALVYANLWITTEENGAFETSPHIGAFRWHEFDREALHTGCFCGPQPMWRKSVHDKHGWFDPTFTSAGDWEFWLRMVSAGEIFKHVDEFLGLYLKREDSVEHQANKAGVARQEMLELQRRHAEKVVA